MLGWNRIVGVTLKSGRCIDTGIMLNTRRTFLKLSGVVLLGASVPLKSLAVDRNAPSFSHRALNGWITDLATEPDAEAAWPSMRLDERLIRDYHEMFTTMRRLGINEMVVWGLYTANNWPVDLKIAVPEERGQMVQRLISDAHKNGIRILSGLGTYSWGFAEIIKANPKLNGGSPNAMCGSEPESHLWMERVLEFMFDRFGIDGVSMQSADQGRCSCVKCAKKGDVEYHTELLTRTAKLIRSKHPKKVIGMSNWGVPFGKQEDKSHLAKLSRSLDYMIDYNDSAQKGGPGYRKELIRGMGCAFGTNGGPVAEPPQHWARDRWFLPSCQRVHEHLVKLHADGGRASEFFYQITANPSSEITLHVAGRTLLNVEVPLEKQMQAVIKELYRPTTPEAGPELAKLFIEAEEAYFQFIAPDPCGTISLEPLVGSKAGPPVYLTERLKPEQRKIYVKAMTKVRDGFIAVRDKVGDIGRLDLCVRCVEAALRDARVG